MLAVAGKQLAEHNRGIRRLRVHVMAYSFEDNRASRGSQHTAQLPACDGKGRLLLAKAQLLEKCLGRAVLL